MSKNKIEVTISTRKIIIYFVVSFIFIAFTVWFSSWIAKPNVVIEEELKPIQNIQKYEAVACPRDFKIYNEEPRQTVDLIAEPTSMYASNGVFIQPKVVITKGETENSNIACGYLYVKAHTSDGPLQTWQNLYINPDNFGGHIDKSNQFGLGDSNDFSEYLFSLDEIRYWKTRKSRGVILEADWAALLNVSDTVAFTIAMNAQDTGAVIDKMSISYKCWDPQTGQENTNCKLKVENRSQTEADTLR